MFENLDIFRMSHAMAVHAGQKQAVSAQNVANADTPGYRAQDLPAFKETYQATPAAPSMLRATRARHLNASVTGQQFVAIDDKQSPSAPNGNSVSLETEMLRSAAAKSQHDRALAIYKASLSILRTTIGR
ncbi:MAG: FlgB family protein [Sulfitobacter sp.]